MWAGPTRNETVKINIYPLQCIVPHVKEKCGGESRWGVPRVPFHPLLFIESRNSVETVATNMKSDGRH